MLPELRPYGIQTSPDGQRGLVDISVAFTRVQRDLQETFRFQPHRGKVILLDSPAHQLLFYKALRRDRADHEEATLRVEEYTRGDRAAATDTQGIPGLTAYDYVIFMGRVPLLDVPGTLAEEVTHGEHIAARLSGGMSKREFTSLFHDITSEFLGYIGKHAVLRKLGRDGKWSKRLTLSYNADGTLGPTVDTLAHLIAFWTLDDIYEKGLILPEERLFHAESEQRVWEIVHDVVGGEVGISFSKELGVGNIEALVNGANRMVQEAKADSVLVFSMA